MRGEYVDAAANLRRAVEEAKAAGLLGKNILGSGFDFELFVHTGAGRYICGEETALINSWKGAAPTRAPSPFPAVSGVWGKPTCVNNVETLCNVPAIIGNGVAWYQGLALPGSEDHGTKLMGFSGKVNNPGLWELPFGITARELFENYAGGMKPGYRLKAWQPGGAGTGFLLPEHLDAQMYAGGIGKVGTRMGTGLAMAVDDSINMVSCCATWKSSSPASPAAGALPAATACPGASSCCARWSEAKVSQGSRHPGAAGQLPRPRQDLLRPCPWRHRAAGQCDEVFPVGIRGWRQGATG